MRDGVTCKSWLALRCGSESGTKIPRRSWWVRAFPPCASDEPLATSIAAGRPPETCSEWLQGLEEPRRGNKQYATVLIDRQEDG